MTQALAETWQTDYLYHGGSATVLDRVKKYGLQPRAIHKGKDNWKHTVTSNKNAVYLTSTYPWHFAAVASNEEVGVIYEIKPLYLLPWLLCPDEDFLEQASRGHGPGPKSPHAAPTDWSMKKRTMHYRRLARYNQKLAAPSLETMGTAAYYGTIPWKGISRYVIIEWKKLHFEFRLRALDSQISILNYKILQDRHKAFVRWFFDDPVTPGELTGGNVWRNAIVEGPDPEGQVKKLNEQYDKMDAGMAQIMQQRDGLTVIKGEENDEAVRSKVLHQGHPLG